MASVSKVKFPWNKALDKSNSRARTPAGGNKSWQRTAVEKLRNDRSNEERGENELALLAKDLTDPESIMNIYFSEIAYQTASDMVEERMDESDSQFVTPREREASRNRSIWRVEDTAKLEVKLLLRNIDTSMPGMARTAASILQMEYGPLHTSLLINNSVLLEWNTGGLVIPERYDGHNQHYPIMTSALHRVSTVSLIRYDPKDEVHLIFEATRNKLDLLNALIRVISRYNGQYFYHAISRNCQTFVIDALKAMGCQNPPQFQGNLRAYFESLKAGNCQPEFNSHDELDRYVRENVISPPREQDRVSLQEKEYLLGQYFQYHIPQMTEYEAPETWQCPMRNCQMRNLERHIDEQAMIMHRFLRIKD